MEISLQLSRLQKNLALTDGMIRSLLRDHAFGVFVYVTFCVSAFSRQLAG